MPDREERSGPGATWSGTISFGLVSIPVSLYPATRTERVTLTTVSAEGLPLRREYCCPSHDRAVPAEEVVRGYEVEEGVFVEVSEEELETLAPQKSRDIDLQRFVPADDLGPLYFERAYFMVPASDSTKAYRLLAETLERSGRVGLATFVMRGKSYLVAIISEGGLLRAETLRFADELRSPKDVGLPERPEPRRSTVCEAKRLLEGHRSAALDPTLLADPTLDETRRLLERKLAAGKDVIEVPEEVDTGEGAEVIDLVEVIKRSLAERKAARRAAVETTRKPTPGQRSREPQPQRETKEQLYERAQALGIQGRSTMNKPDLAKAVRRASARAGKADAG